jgi:hypothetical protein
VAFSGVTYTNGNSLTGAVHGDMKSMYINFTAPAAGNSQANYTVTLNARM